MNKHKMDLVKDLSERASNTFTSLEHLLNTEGEEVDGLYVQLQEINRKIRRYLVDLERLWPR